MRDYSMLSIEPTPKVNLSTEKDSSNMKINEVLTALGTIAAIIGPKLFLIFFGLWGWPFIVTGAIVWGVGCVVVMVGSAVVALISHFFN